MFGLIDFVFFFFVFAKVVIRSEDVSLVKTIGQTMSCANHNTKSDHLTKLKGKSLDNVSAVGVVATS